MASPIVQEALIINRWTCPRERDASNLQDTQSDVWGGSAGGVMSFVAGWRQGWVAAATQSGHTRRSRPRGPLLCWHCVRKSVAGRPSAGTSQMCNELRVTQRCDRRGDTIAWKLRYIHVLTAVLTSHFSLLPDWFQWLGITLGVYPEIFMLYWNFTETVG